MEEILTRDDRCLNDEDEHSNSSLHNAAKEGHFAVAQTLINAGADKDCRWAIMQRESMCETTGTTSTLCQVIFDRVGRVGGLVGVKGWGWSVMFARKITWKERKSSEVCAWNTESWFGMCGADWVSGTCCQLTGKRI